MYRLAMASTNTCRFCKLAEFTVIPQKAIRLKPQEISRNGKGMWYKYNHLQGKPSTVVKLKA
jgi:hypothetical protein